METVRNDQLNLDEIRTQISPPKDGIYRVAIDDFDEGIIRESARQLKACVYQEVKTGYFLFTYKYEIESEPEKRIFIDYLNPPPVLEESN